MSDKPNTAQEFFEKLIKKVTEQKSSDDGSHEEQLKDSLLVLRSVLSEFILPALSPIEDPQFILVLEGKIARGERKGQGASLTVSQVKSKDDLLELIATIAEIGSDILDEEGRENDSRTQH